MRNKSNLRSAPVFLLVNTNRLCEIYSAKLRILPEPEMSHCKQIETRTILQMTCDRP